MKFVIWGIGTRGKMLVDCLGHNYIEAIIDNDAQLYGTTYKGHSIIRFEDYWKDYVKYKNYFVVITSTVWANEMISDLEKHGIFHYFDLLRAPKELISNEGSILFDAMLGTLDPLLLSETIVLVGINIFSILLYDYLSQKGYKKLFFMILDEEKRLVENIQLINDIYQFIPVEAAMENGGRILLTDRFIHKTTIAKSLKKTECFYSFSFRSKTKRDSLVWLKGIHQGKRGFVIGTGPSLRVEDLNKLKDYGEICLSANTIYDAFEFTQWRPNYYFWGESTVTDKDIADIIAMDVKWKFFGDKKNNAVNKIQNALNIYIYRIIQDYFGNEGPDFSGDINNGVYYGYTILYQCLQFAVYMGFSEVFLIGADCEYKNYGGVGDHFIDRVIDNMPRYNLETEKIFLAYQSAKRYADNHGVAIYNATRGGKLEVFPRVDFNSLF